MQEAFKLIFHNKKAEKSAENPSKDFFTASNIALELDFTSSMLKLVQIAAKTSIRSFPMVEFSS